MRAPARPDSARPARHGNRVDGAGAGRAHPGDVERLVLEQPVEHAPGEGAVRAATLERQIEALLPPENAQELVSRSRSSPHLAASVPSELRNYKGR